MIDPPGFDAGKKIKGKKRHILVDTQGLLMQAIVDSAGIQDRDCRVAFNCEMRNPMGDVTLTALLLFASRFLLI